MRRGEQKRNPTPGGQKGHHLCGAYNWRTDEVITMKAEAKTSEAFCLFIEYLMQLVSDDRPMVLVMDNASYHHSYVSQATLAYFEDRFLPFWLPTHCSKLNMIERFWLHLKQLACANRLNDSRVA